MDYRIETKPAFTVGGVERRISTKGGENFQSIPKFWDETIASGNFQRIESLQGGGSIFPRATFGICADFDEQMSTFTYMIAAEASPTAAAPDGLTLRAIPASQWAVFEAKGALPDSIQSVWKAIGSEFFGSEPYRHGDSPDLEVYPPGNPMSDEFICEVWVSVAAK